MRKIIAIIIIVLALGFWGLSQLNGHSEETGQEKTHMTQMMEMMKDMNMKMDKMMNSCMGMMQNMHGSEGKEGGMIQHHEGMMKEK